MKSRMQTAMDRSKAMKQYEALRRSNMVVKAVVIAELKDGTFHILGQELTPHEMSPLLVVAAESLAQAEADRKVVKLVAHQEPVKRGEWNRSKPRVKKIKKAPDGTLIPPAGENFVSCGECDHPTWFVLHSDIEDITTRYACAHCGNEVEQIRITHEEGHA